MKKRLFTLALVVGVLLSLSAYAWAGNKYITTVETEYKVVHVSSDRVSEDFIIRVKADTSDTSNATQGSTSVDKIVWQVSCDAKTPAVNLVISKDTKSGVSIDQGWSGANTYEVFLHGKLSGDGVVRVTATLISADQSTPASIKFAEVTFTSAAGSDDVLAYGNGGTLFAGKPSEDPFGKSLDDGASGTTAITSRDYGDAYNDDLWNGLDPKFNAAGVATTENKGKLKISGINPKKPSFTAGEVGEAVITITGSNPKEIDVYIAAKDTVKLFGVAKDSAKDISLTKKNIQDSLAKGYSIPFRVVSHEISSEDSKNASSTITLAFNGAKVSFKGYPITVSATNAIMNGKYAKKTFKIDVSPSNTKAPIYWDAAAEGLTDAVSSDGETPLYTEEVSTYDYDKYKKAINAVYATDGYRVSEIDNSVVSKEVVSSDADNKIVLVSSDNSTTAVNANSKDIITDYEFVSNDESTQYYLSATLSTASASAGWKLKMVSVDATLYTYTKDYTYDGYAALDAKDAKKAEIPVSTSEERDNGVVPETIYHVGMVSGEYGPYTITAKPTAADAATKLSKNLKGTPIFTIYPPVLNGLGEISEDGYVVVAEGEKVSLVEMGKETKSALTFTATTANKKKAALKSTIRGMIAPYFEEKTATEKTVDGLKILYLNGVKRVEAGKVPSVKLKAKGSKTISYYTDYGDELKEVGLSLDTKGKLFALNKGTTYPTIGSDGKFASLDIWVEARNGAGYEEVLVEIPITGAKPKFVGKTAELTAGTVGIAGIDMKAGKNAPTASDDIVFTVDATNKAILDKLGVSIVTLETAQVLSECVVPVYSGDKTVSADALTFASGDVISKDGVLGSRDHNYVVYGTPTVHVQVSSADASKDYGVSTDVSVDIAGATTVTVYWGKLSADNSSFIYDMKTVSKELISDGKVVTKKDNVTVSADESFRNKLILQSTTATKAPSDGKPVTVTFIASNLGSAAANGKVKITINAATATKTKNAQGTAEKTATATRTGKSSAGTSKFATVLPDGVKVLAEETPVVDIDDSEEEETEATITLGEPRTVADLTAEQVAAIKDEGYIIVAVLPEMTVTESGQYDLDVELDENAAEGAELKWFAFPKAAPSEDDEIVDFYDEAGTPVEGVPASHKIIASPWLNAEVTYAPVIAVKADVAEVAEPEAEEAE